jgi:aspartate-semialdehyde dehydrogenase
MRMRTKCTPAQRAAKYLERIAALTGAKQDNDGSYRLTAGRRDFLVDSRIVRVISSRGQSTCFYVATDREIPSAEVVASALLELKNNPRLFEKWRDRRGSTFKANGKMFRAAYRDFYVPQL